MSWHISLRRSGSLPAEKSALLQWRELVDRLLQLPERILPVALEGIQRFVESFERSAAADRIVRGTGSG
jgi:hypothetical protein